jgi:hypothetical protein
MKCCRRTKVPETDCFAELTVGTNAQTVRFFLARERSDRAFEGTRELPAVEGSMRISPHVSGVSGNRISLSEVCVLCNGSLHCKNNGFEFSGTWNRHLGM